MEEIYIACSNLGFRKWVRGNWQKDGERYQELLGDGAGMRDLETLHVCTAL